MLRLDKLRQLDRYESAVLERGVLRAARSGRNETQEDTETRFLVNLFSGVKPYWWEMNEERLDGIRRWDE